MKVKELLTELRKLDKEGNVFFGDGYRLHEVEFASQDDDGDAILETYLTPRFE